MSRLLATTPFEMRRVTSDEDAWAVRLGALATLAQYDALALAVPGQRALSRTFNVVDPGSDPAVASALDESARTRAIAHVRVALELADGRLAAAALVAPLAGEDDAPAGSLVALRVGRAFGSADALTASGVAQLASVELVREAAARRDAADRRQALMLYELARLALFHDDPDDGLGAVATMLAGSLAHDLVQIWACAEDGSLRLVASSPGDELTKTISHPSHHEPLGTVLEARRIERIRRPSRRSWVPDHIADLLVAPLVAGDDVRGVLVVGRARQELAAEDVELASVVASFVARVLRRPADAAAASEWEDEPELLRS